MRTCCSCSQSQKAGRKKDNSWIQHQAHKSRFYPADEAGSRRKEADSFSVTRRGTAWVAELGIDVEPARALRRKFAATCLDWSERRDHLGGALGAALAERLVDLGWIARKRNSRAVAVTEAGKRKLAEHFALEP